MSIYFNFHGDRHSRHVVHHAVLRLHEIGLMGVISCYRCTVHNPLLKMFHSFQSLSPKCFTYLHKIHHYSIFFSSIKIIRVTKVWLRETFPSDGHFAIKWRTGSHVLIDFVAIYIWTDGLPSDVGQFSFFSIFLRAAVDPKKGIRFKKIQTSSHVHFIKSIQSSRRNFYKFSVRRPIWV